MRSIIELVKFYNNNKDDINVFLKRQTKENFHSLRKAYRNSGDKSSYDKMVSYMGSNESIIFWIIDLIIMIIAIYLIVSNGQYMSNVSVAFAVMLLLLPIGPIFSIVIVLISRRIPEKIKKV